MRNHSRYTELLVYLVLLLIVFMGGCESAGTDILEPPSVVAHKSQVVVPNSEPPPGLVEIPNAVQDAIDRARQKIERVNTEDYPIDWETGVVKKGPDGFYVSFEMTIEEDIELSGGISVARFVITMLNNKLHPTSVRFVEIVSPYGGGVDSKPVPEMAWTSGSAIYVEWFNYGEYRSAVAQKNGKRLKYMRLKGEQIDNAEWANNKESIATSVTAKTSSITSGGTCLVLIYLLDGEVTGYTILSCSGGDCDPEQALSCGGGGGSGTPEEEEEEWDWDVTASHTISPSVVRFFTDGTTFPVTITSTEFKIRATAETNTIVTGFLNPVSSMYAYVYADTWVNSGGSTGTMILDAEEESFQGNGIPPAKVSDYIHLIIATGESITFRKDSLHSGKVRTWTGGWKPAIEHHIADNYVLTG